MISEITSFSQVVLAEKSILIFDIDETVLKYDQINQSWWNTKIKHFYEIYEDQHVANQKAHDLWITHVDITLPEYTDKNGFFDLVNKAHKINIPIIFITARPQYLDELTIRHLNHLNINVGDVYYTNRSNKGIAMENIIEINYPNINEIIFIEDSQHNIHDVINHMSGKNRTIHCYKYSMS